MKPVWMVLLASGCEHSLFLEDPPITNHVDDWRDEVIYQVLVDRFADGDVNNDFNKSWDPNDLARYQGGDYQGLIDQVGYLETLGVTAIWISPVVANVEEDAGVAGYHGYWTQNFEEVNPHFGDLAKLRELVAVMHQHGIKVIVDIVVNHVGQLFYYDINMNGQGDVTAYYATNGSDELDLVTEWDPGFDPRRIQAFTSLGESGDAPLGWVYDPAIDRMPPEPSEFQNPDWYNRMGRVDDWGSSDQVVYGDFPGGLKDLATENPNVREALIRVFSDWITHTDIDGYRIDTVKHVEHGFWTEFCPAIRAHAADLGKQNFLLFGEAFDGDDALIGGYTTTDELDSVAYFSQKYRVFDGVFAHGGPTAAVEDLFAERLDHWGLEPQDGGVGVAPVDLPVNFIDNHDVPRFLNQQPDERALKTALLFLLTEPGIPVLYYGTEQGFSGGNDPANREPIWPTGYRTDGPLYRYIQELTAIRRDHPALRRGDLTFVASDADGPGILAYERATDDDRVLVVINTADEPATVAAAVSFTPGATMVDALSSAEVAISADGTLSVELAPRTGVILAER
ncbi:MAG: alpha-amylase family glycosyl hydrolase [Myxococcota bacterium]